MSARTRTWSELEDRKPIYALVANVDLVVILEKFKVPHREEIFPVIIITVVMSVLLHGLTAVPGAKMYARVLERFRDDGLHEHGEVVEHRVKIRHSK